MQMLAGYEKFKKLHYTSEVSNEQCIFDKRASYDTNDNSEHYWLKISAHIHGAMKEKVFLNTVTLLLN